PASTSVGGAIPTTARLADVVCRSGTVRTGVLVPTLLCSAAGRLASGAEPSGHESFSRQAAPVRSRRALSVHVRGQDNTSAGGKMVAARAAGALLTDIVSRPLSTSSPSA